jgi:murein DD-endopeptidase MepM/ murein hydrolase activator NlpD
MKIRSTVKIILFLAFISAVAVFWSSWGRKPVATDNAKAVEVSDEKIPPIIPDKKVLLEVKDGDTYGKLMGDAEVGSKMTAAIYDAAKDKYDLVKIRLGKFLEMVYDNDTNELKELVYKIDTEEELSVKNAKFFPVASSTVEWTAELRAIVYEVKLAVREGEVQSSMYQAAIDNNIDIRAIIELADAFQWSIDFAMDPRVGDKFKFVYEERFLDGQPAAPGKVLAGYYVNDGTRYEAYYFHESDENEGYFDADGNSAQKMFLKAPVAFKYISSGFTTGLRYIEAFNVSTGHRAVDYAAAVGTPIRAVGDGKILQAAWNGGYGNFVSIRHNGTYTTNYGHLSKFAVKKGASVKQGQIIGYVGSTGFSTGPHLHYEMVKNGVKINPLKEVLPPGQAVKDENKDRFKQEMSKWREMLGLVQ